MDYLCSICQKPIRGIFRGDFICHSCYKTWKDAIENKEPWVLYCEAWERDRRRQDSYMENGQIKQAEFVYLSDKFDIAEDGKVIPTTKYFEEVD